MIQHIDAIYEDGVFRPEQPVNIGNGERVSLSVESKPAADDPSDVADLLDVEYIEACRRRAGKAPSLEEVRKALSVIKGSMSDRISEERDER